METVRAAAQHHGVAALQAQGARVRRDVRPALIDDPDDAEGRRHPLDDETVGTGESRENPPDRIRKRGDLLDAARDRLDAAGIEGETVQEGGVEPVRLAVGEIARVCGENVGRAFAQGPRGGHQRTVLPLRRRVGERARRRARLGADGAHSGTDFCFGLEHLSGDGHGKIL